VYLGRINTLKPKTLKYYLYLLNGDEPGNEPASEKHTSLSRRVAGEQIKVRCLFPFSREKYPPVFIGLGNFAKFVCQFFQSINLFS